MTPNDHTRDPETRAEFEEAVRTLVVTAHENGVCVEDGIDIRTLEDGPDWGVEITRLRPQRDD